MAEFPSLKTGAVVQFPLSRTLRNPVQAVSFMDGSRQVYRLRGAATRRWFVRLDHLDPDELNAVIDFAETQGTDTFPFLDPVTGLEVPRCVVGEQGLHSEMYGELHGQTLLTIEETP